MNEKALNNEIIFNKQTSALVIGIIITAVSVLNGCDVDHTLNPNKYGKVYMPTAVGKTLPSYSVLTDFDTTYTIFYGAAYGGPKRTIGAIPVSFNVNPALVDSFNTTHLTSYAILPEKVYTLGKKEQLFPPVKKVHHR